MHDPIELTLSISDIPKIAYWKNNEGKVMLTIQVCERQKPSEKGSTHYATIYDKDAKEKKYIAHGKFKPYVPQPVNDSDLPPTGDDIEDAQVVNNESKDDLPF